MSGAAPKRTRPAGRAGTGRPTAARTPGPRPAPAMARLPRRWPRIVVASLLALAVLVALPIAHALVGELGALLVGALVLGFLLGRWTLRFP